MRAFAVQSFGEAPAIHDLPIPAEDGGFLVRVRYAGVNPIDYKLIERLTARRQGRRIPWECVRRVGAKEVVVTPDPPQRIVKSSASRNRRGTRRPSGRPSKR